MRKELLFFPTWAILAFCSYLITVGDIGQRMSRVVGLGKCKYIPVMIRFNAPPSPLLGISVSVLILKYYSGVSVRINGDSPYLIVHIVNAALYKKQMSSSEFLNYYIHVSA